MSKYSKIKQIFDIGRNSFFLRSKDRSRTHDQKSNSMLCVKYDSNLIHSEFSICTRTAKVKLISTIKLGIKLILRKLILSCSYEAMMTDWVANKTSKFYHCMAVLCCAVVQTSHAVQSRPLQCTNEDRTIQQSEYISVNHFAEKTCCNLIIDIYFAWLTLCARFGSLHETNERQATILGIITS